MFVIKYHDVLGVAVNELGQISYKCLYFTPYSHPPSFDILSERGCVGTVVRNIANEINMLGCVTLVTRYDAVVGESVQTFC